MAGEHQSEAEGLRNGEGKEKNRREGVEWNCEHQHKKFSLYPIGVKGHWRFGVGGRQGFKAVFLESLSCSEG